MPREHGLGAGQFDLDGGPRRPQFDLHRHAAGVGAGAAASLPTDRDVEQEFPSLPSRLERRPGDADRQIVGRWFRVAQQREPHRLRHLRHRLADRRPGAIRHLPVVGPLVGADPDRASGRLRRSDLIAGRLQQEWQIGCGGGGLRLGHLKNSPW